MPTQTTTTTNGNTTTITTTQTTLTANTNGDYTKTTTSQTLTLTKDDKGKVNQSIGKQQQTVETGNSKKLGGMVGGMISAARRGALTGGIARGFFGDKMLSLATGEKVTTSNVKGLMPGMQTLANKLGRDEYAGKNGIDARMTVHNIRVTEEIGLTGVAAMTCSPAAIVGIPLVIGGIATHDLKFEY